MTGVFVYKARTPSPLPGIGKNHDSYQWDAAPRSYGRNVNNTAYTTTAMAYEQPTLQQQQSQQAAFTGYPYHGESTRNDRKGKTGQTGSYPQDLSSAYGAQVPGLSRKEPKPLPLTGRHRQHEAGSRSLDPAEVYAANAQHVPEAYLTFPTADAQRPSTRRGRELERPQGNLVDGYSHPLLFQPSKPKEPEQNFAWPRVQSGNSQEENLMSYPTRQRSRSSRGQDRPDLRAAATPQPQAEQSSQQVRQRTISSSVRLSSLLAKDSRDMITYDVSLHWYLATRVSSRRGTVKLSPRELSEAACSPGRETMRIIISEYPDWPIFARCKEREYVTVENFLSAVFDTLHQHVDATRRANMSRAVREAFGARCAKMTAMIGHEAGLSEQHQGPVCSDWLEQRTIFKGLVKSRHTDGSEIWNLVLDYPANLRGNSRRI